MTDNPPMKMYVNKKENRITLRVKTRFCLELLTLKMIILVASTKLR